MIGLPAILPAWSGLSETSGRLESVDDVETEEDEKVTEDDEESSDSSFSCVGCGGCHRKSEGFRDCKNNRLLRNMPVPPPLEMGPTDAELLKRHVTE